MRYALVMTTFLMCVIPSYYILQFAEAQSIERCDAEICHVEITEDGFVPKTLIVTIGTTIVWTNTDDGRHTVTSGSPGEIAAPLKSLLLEKGDTYEFNFQHAGLYKGNYKYFDQVTKIIRGEIIVEAGKEVIEEAPEPHTIEIDFNDPKSGVKILSFPNASIKSIEIDLDFHSLIINVEDVQGGSKLEITLDRNLIDSKTDAKDDDFEVLVDGGEGFFEEISSTATERTLQIVVPNKATLIEIIGKELLTEGVIPVTYQDSTFDVMTFLSSGSVKSIQVDPDFNSIILAVESSADGELAITLPRALIDSKTDGEDDEFIVILDGDETEYREHSASATERTLTIPVFAGAEELEILGTQVIPEFPISLLVIAGTFTALIAAYRVRKI